MATAAALPSAAPPAAAPPPTTIRLMNPFAIRRSALSSQVAYMKECVLNGQIAFPHPPPAVPAVIFEKEEEKNDEMSVDHEMTPTSASAASSSHAAVAATSSASPLTSTQYSAFSQYGPNAYGTTPIRTACFYQLFPEMWRRQERQYERFQEEERQRRQQEERRENDEDTAVAMDTSSSSSTSASTTAAASSSSSSIAPLTASHTTAAATTTTHRLRLRPRSPRQHVWTSSSFSSNNNNSTAVASSSTPITNHGNRSIYEAEFSAGIINATPHISIAPDTGVNQPGAPPRTLDPVTGYPVVVGGAPGQLTACVYPNHNRFSKPVADMGDYLSVIRSTITLRNVMADQLDDPAVVQQFAKKHGREKERERENNLMTMTKDPSISMPWSDPNEGAATSSIMRRLTPPMQRPQLRYPPSGLSSASSSPPSSPSRLTVDEADAMMMEQSNSGNSSPGGPGSPATRRRRNTRQRSTKPSMMQFIAMREKQMNNNSAATGNLNSSAGSSRSTSPFSPFTSAAAASGRSTSPVSPSSLSSSSSSLTAIATVSPSTEPTSTPSISTLLASMSRPRPKSPLMRNPHFSSSSSSPPSSQPAVLSILYRLDCHLPRKMFSESETYLKVAQEWWRQQLKELIQNSAAGMKERKQMRPTTQSESKEGASNEFSTSSPSSTVPSSILRVYELAFSRWKSELLEQYKKLPEEKKIKIVRLDMLDWKRIQV